MSRGTLRGELQVIHLKQQLAVVASPLSLQFPYSLPNDHPCPSSSWSANSGPEANILTQELSAEALMCDIRQRIRRRNIEAASRPDRGEFFLVPQKSHADSRATGWMVRLLVARRPPRAFVRSGTPWFESASLQWSSRPPNARETHGSGTGADEPSLQIVIFPPRRCGRH